MRSEPNLTRPDGAVAVRELFTYDSSRPLSLRLVASDGFGDAVVTEVRFAAARGGEVSALIVESNGAPSGLPGVVCAHGGPEPAKYGLVEQAAELSCAGLTVVLPDTSMPPPGDVGSERAFGDAVLVQRRSLDLLAARGARRFGHFGYSFGGAQAAVLSAVEPRLDAIVIAGNGTGGVEMLRLDGITDEGYLTRVERLDPIHYVSVPGRRQLFVQQGRFDQANRGTLPEAARAMFDAAAPPKRWAEYDCDHAIDGHPPALADRIAFFKDSLLDR